MQHLRHAGRGRALLITIAVVAGLSLFAAACSSDGAGDTSTLKAGAFAAIPLACVILVYLVTQRQREIGIRLALGAGPRDVGRQVLGGGLAMVAAGLALGLAGALALVGVMKTLLYEVDSNDPVALGAAVGIMLVTAVAACWRPMRRAMRIDPVQLLKD